MPAPLATAIAITGLGFVLVAIFGSALTKIGPVQFQNVDPPTRIKAGVIGGVLMVVAWWGLRQADGDNGVLISVYSPLDAATTEMVRDHARDAGLAIEFLGSEVRASGIVDLMRQVRSDWERGAQASSYARESCC